MSNGKNRDVLVIGGGIAGMQSALLLAEKDHRVYVLDSAPAIGGFFPLLDRTFPTNSCGVCFMSPKPPAYCPIYENDFHENIELLTNCDIRGLQGRVPSGRGDFQVTYVERPKYVDIQKCTLCDKCVEVCPVEVDREFGGGLEKRKAIYLPFVQAIPRCYVIDENVCTRCGECLKVCSPEAINLEEEPRVQKLNVGAIVLGLGFEPFQGEIKGEYGLGRYKNVLSSLQYERMLSFSSPTQGIPRRLSDEKQPQKVAFIQCVGSRDPSCDQKYCSSICCMYATKQAMISKDRLNDLDVAVFYMDIRAMGKDYERYYERAKEEYGIRYLRSAISTVRELQQSKNLSITYGLENGELKEEEFDMAVLSVGFTAPQSVRKMAELIGVGLNEYDFCATDEFSPTETSVPGIFVAGAFRGPQDIPQTVVEACSAASDVSRFLDDFEESKIIEEKAEDDEIIDDEILRIGVFICDNKGLLSEGVDIEKIIEEIKKEQDVLCVEEIDVTSLKQGLDEIENKVADNELNRIVIAGYRGIELSKAIKGRKFPLGKGGTKGGFGSDSNLIDYANIGEQCVNVHRDTPLLATKKAISLIQASLKKVKLATPKMRGKKEVCGRILVVGGGISGLSSSLSLAEQGMDVTLVEKDEELGGNARFSHYTLKGSDVQNLVQEMVAKVEEHPKIEILKGAELSSLEGSWGSYRSLVSVGGEEKEITHGAVIFATGGKEVKPEEYLYGENQNVITQREFERMLFNGGGELDNAESLWAGKSGFPKERATTVVMIQCVGSRNEEHPYCSRVCCSHAVKNALKLKELNPEANIYVLYRDMRTYGFYEEYYHLAREKGILFVRYEPSEKPKISSENGSLKVSFFDGVVGEKVDVESDLLVLSTGIEPNDNQKLAELTGVELNEDGFFEEANPKSAPLDSVDRGKYFCGLCHSPNFIEGAICQGKAAAARASSLLWRGIEEYADNQAYVKERRCSGCGICVSACPYHARVIDEIKNKAQVLEDLCKGCGTCVMSCPNGASQQYNFENSTILDVLDEIIW